MLQQIIEPRSLLTERFSTYERQVGNSLPSVQEILELSNTNFTVTKKPMYLISPDQSRGYETNKYVLGKSEVEDHMFNSVVTSRYHVIQNFDMLEMGLELIDKFNSKNEFNQFEFMKAGKSFDSSIAYYTFGVNDILVPTIGLTNYYLVIVADHNKCSCKILFTPIKVICHNQLGVAHRKSTWSLSLSHRISFTTTKALDKFSYFFSNSVLELENAWQRMSSKVYQYSDYQKAIRRILSIPEDTTKYSGTISNTVKKNLVALDEVYYQGIGQETLEDNTMAKAVSAITTFESNYSQKTLTNLREYFNPSLSAKFAQQVRRIIHI